MKVNISGRHVSVNEELESYAREKADKIGKFFYDGDRPKPPGGRIKPLDQPRPGIKCIEVTAKTPANVRPQNFDRNTTVAALRLGDLGLVHLCDRCRGD